MIRHDLIQTLTGDRLTAEKADHICERDGYTVTGVVLTHADGRACIVNLSAVRWLSAEFFWYVLHDDGADPLRSRIADQAADIAMLRDEAARQHQEILHLRIYSPGQHQAHVVKTIKQIAPTDWAFYGKEEPQQ